MVTVPRTMEAIRLHARGVDGLRHDTIDTPTLLDGEALVEVHAAAITRDELEWPLDRLPAVPSYELCGVVAAVADDVDTVAVGDEVYALTPFDREWNRGGGSSSSSRASSTAASFASQSTRRSRSPKRPPPSSAASHQASTARSSSKSPAVHAQALTQTRGNAHRCWPT